MNRTVTLLSAASCLLLGAACTSDNPPTAADIPPAAPQAADTQTQDATSAVLAAFDGHQIVGGFSAGHGNKETDDFLLDLIRDPRLPAVVDDIVIECGNSLYQDVLDRYIAGDDVLVQDVQHVWRDTTQGGICGFNTFYEQLIPLVRRVNADLPDDQKLRVLAADPPIDWSQVASKDDRDSYGGRDEVIAQVVEREVLEKDRHALMLFGIHHMQHGAGVDSAVQMYEDHGHPGVTYVIGDHFGFADTDTATNDELEAKMTDWPTPSITPIKGTWLGELDSASFHEPPGTTGYPGVDAYLYVGPRDTLLREPRSAQAMLDKNYITELEHRAASLDAPPGGPANPSTQIQQEATAGVFSYDPDADGGGSGPGAASGSGPAGPGTGDTNPDSAPSEPAPQPTDGVEPTGS